MIEQAAEARVTDGARTELKFSVQILTDLALGASELQQGVPWSTVSVESTKQKTKIIITETSTGDLKLMFKNDTYSSNGVHGTTDATVELHSDGEVLAEERWTAASTHPRVESHSGTRRGNNAAQQLAIRFINLANLIPQQAVLIEVQ